MKKLKLYLDNCCFNRPFDDHSQLIVQLETEAVLYIQEGIKNETFELVWSYILDVENDVNSNKLRKSSIRTWRERSVVIVKPNEKLKQIAADLQLVGLHIKDSLHLACAIASQCDYFVTTDYRILNKPIEQIPVVNPIYIIQLFNEAQDA